MREVVGRYAVFVAGLWFLAVGIVLIVRGNLGATPISSPNYVMHLNTPLSLGAWTFITNLLMIAAQLWLARGKQGTWPPTKDVVEILLQVPFSFVFSVFIDINMALTAGIVPGSWLASLGLLLAGCVIQAFAVVLEIKPRVAMMSAEGLVKYICQRYGLRFGTTKVWLDTSLVLIAVTLSLLFAGRIDGVREGTVIAALITGHFVTWEGKVVDAVWRRIT